MSASQTSAGAVVVSACLLGRRCRFDGCDKFTPELAFILEGRRVIPVCPEELGQLGTPRPACHLVGGDGADVIDGQARVIDTDGRDRTDAFQSGAEAALAAALTDGAVEAILKENSPSCGVASVYRDGKPRPGVGVFTAMLKRSGVAVRSELEAVGVNRHARRP